MFKKLQFLILLLLSASVTWAQQIEGVVKDSQDQPVIGATVVVKGTKIFAVTDVDGQFNFTPPKEFPFSIRISSTGFRHQDIQFFELLDEALEITLADANVLSE